jgi:5-methylcytosine-specific restriction endonuclease McrA
MFNSEQDPLSLLIEITPKLAKKRYRQSIYEAWDYCCAYCEEPATSLDHIVPRFKSGSSNRHNLIPACRRCNTNKASQKMEEWYLQQDFFNEARFSRIKSWHTQEPIDACTYNVHTASPYFAAG